MDEDIFGWKELAKETGLGKQTLQRLMREEILPKPQAGARGRARAVQWAKSDIKDWKSTNQKWISLLLRK
jgi:predicted DNA-binding transcriptional regulator AlpA